MINKLCNKCCLIKNICEFTKNGNLANGDTRYRSFCKSCLSAIAKKYYERTIEQRREYSNKYYLKTKDVRRSKRIEFARKWQKKNKERCNLNVFNWAKNNPDKIKQINRRRTIKKLSTIKGRISNAVSTKVRKILRGAKLRRYWEDIIGYNYNDLKNHLESKFTDGMSWTNYGKNGWHIDHIVPISFFEYSSFNDPEFKMCWRLENLRPLWARDNIQKGNSLLKIPA